MPELSFLISLLLEHKLPAKTKTAIQARIKEVEATLVFTRPPTQATRPSPTAQAPYTQAALDRHDLASLSQQGNQQSVAVIAQTPAAATALQHRADALATAGRIMPNSTSARKF